MNVSKNKKEITKTISKYLETNENKTQHTNTGNRVKARLRGAIISHECLY